MPLIHAALGSPRASITAQDPTVAQTIREQVRQSIQDAAEEARDAAQEVRDGQQHLRDAQQHVREMQQGVREAEQRVREAQQQVRAATRPDQRAAAQQSLNAAQDGVREAEAAVRDADAQVREAERQLRDVGHTRAHTIQLPPDMQHVIPPQAVDLAIGFFIMCAVIVIGWPIARAFGRRIERPRAGAPLDSGLGDQLQRIEQAVEAMSIEVERISEAQRFTTRLQTGSVQPSIAQFERP
jgi:DNA repair exonuclease SbcCD ATPase subunit